MKIQAVFFDMGGTLERLWHVRERRLEVTPGLKACLQEAGIEVDLSVQDLCDRVSDGYDRYRKWSITTTEELPPERVWSDFILASLPVDGKKLAAAADRLMFYLESNYYQRQLRPEVPAVLSAIRKMGLKMGLISNVCSRGLVPLKLEEYGIRDYFDPIVLSSTYGRRKPDPAIFHYAARLASVPTGRSLYVGDRIARDVAGARRAGFALAVQIINDFDHGEDDEGPQPDAVIHSMDELLDLLQSQEKAPDWRSTARQTGETGIRAFLFDAGDILYERPRRSEQLDAFLAGLGLVGRQMSPGQRKELKDQAFRGAITQSQYREGLLRLYGVSDPEQIQRGSRAIGADEDCIEFFDGVRETLTALKDSGYMLGIVTDTANPIHIKLSWFERGGFGHVWDCIISSKEIGVEKPDPRIYEAALRQLGISAGQAVFVGHSPEELDGARAIGMKTIAFNYEPASRADFYIRRFSDLRSVPLIESQPSPSSS